MNSYEMLGRERKVARILMELDAEYGHIVTEAELNEITDERLKRCIKNAAINTPSADTIEALVNKIRVRDAMRGAK